MSGLLESLKKGNRTLEVKVDNLTEEVLLLKRENRELTMENMKLKNDLRKANLVIERLNKQLKETPTSVLSDLVRRMGY